LSPEREPGARARRSQEGASSEEPVVELVRLEVDLPSQRLHKAEMSKTPRVVFKPKRIAEGDWQIIAEYPGVEDRYIKGLKSKAEVDEWMNGTRRIDWLRSQGYAK
jgi:hypothetical protein